MSGGAWYTTLVAFVNSASSQQEAQQRIISLLPREAINTAAWEGAGLDCWWVAEDERWDGSDCEAAVFVPGPLTQARSREILETYSEDEYRGDPVDLLVQAQALLTKYGEATGRHASFDDLTIWEWLSSRTLDGGADPILVMREIIKRGMRLCDPEMQQFANHFYQAECDRVMEMADSIIQMWEDEDEEEYSTEQAQALLDVPTCDTCGAQTKRGDSK